MANLKVKDADSNSKFLKAMGEGTNEDPLVIEHSDSAVLSKLNDLTTDIEFFDYSGNVTEPYTSICPSNNSERKCLQIQNLGKFNEQTNNYEGDLWITFVYPPIPDIVVVSRGAGSYRLAPNSFFNYSMGFILRGYIYLTSNVAGVEYTYKESGFSITIE